MMLEAVCGIAYVTLVEQVSAMPVLDLQHQTFFANQIIVLRPDEHKWFRPNAKGGLCCARSPLVAASCRNNNICFEC